MSLVNHGPAISQRLTEIWGARVSSRRQQLGLTQEQVAQISGLSQQTISNIEAGRHLARDDVKIALAKALGTTPGELFPWPPMEDLIGGAA
jgi:transcriptional regulator with XRE-family HTH domain